MPVKLFSFHLLEAGGGIGAGRARAAGEAAAGVPGQHDGGHAPEQRRRGRGVRRHGAGPPSHEHGGHRGRNEVLVEVGGFGGVVDARGAALELFLLRGGEAHVHVTVGGGKRSNYAPEKKKGRKQIRGESRYQGEIRS